MKKMKGHTTKLASDTILNIPQSSKCGEHNLSRYGLLKVLVIITTLTFILYYTDGNHVLEFGGWKPIEYSEFLVWHYGFTMAVLEFKGKKRKLVNCRLILVETRYFYCYNQLAIIIK